MRTSSPERGRARPGLVVLGGALVGTLAGLGLPGVGSTTAQFTSRATVETVISVPVCSGAWAAQVLALAPALHWSFDGVGSPAGDVPAPGLLACDPTAALTLHGGVDEGVQAPAPTLLDASASTVALMVAPSDVSGTGELVRLTASDGHWLGARLTDGWVELVEQPVAGSAVTLGSVAVAPGETHLVTITRSGASATLWLDDSDRVNGTLIQNPALPATVTVGAPGASGLASARAVVDELVVLPTALDDAGVAALVAADRW